MPNGTNLHYRRAVSPKSVAATLGLRVISHREEAEVSRVLNHVSTKLVAPWAFGKPMHIADKLLTLIVRL
jgi:hypothetical protein